MAALIHMETWFSFEKNTTSFKSFPARWQQVVCWHWSLESYGKSTHYYSTSFSMYSIMTRYSYCLLKLHHLELTVPTNSPKDLYQARSQKLNKPEYNYSISDLEIMGWIPSYETIALGHLPSPSFEAIADILPSDRSKSAASTLLDTARAFITCCHQIFMPHKQPT